MLLLAGSIVVGDRSLGGEAMSLYTAASTRRVRRPRRRPWRGAQSAVRDRRPPLLHRISGRVRKFRAAVRPTVPSRSDHGGVHSWMSRRFY